MKTQTLSTETSRQGLGPAHQGQTLCLSTMVCWFSMCHGVVRPVSLSGGQDALLQGRLEQTQIEGFRPDCQHMGKFLPRKPAGIERDLRLHTRISSLQVLAFGLPGGRKGGNQHLSPCSMPGPELGAFMWGCIWPPSHPLRMWRSERWSNLHKVTKPPSLFAGINPKVTSCFLWYPRLHQHPSKMPSGLQVRRHPAELAGEE